MKKLISILCLLTAFTITSFAGENKEELTKAEVVSAVFSEVKDSIEDLAASLKITAEEAWDILVWQQTIESMSNLSIIAIMIALSIFIYKKSQKRADEENDDIFDYAITGIPAGLSLIVGGIYLLLFMINFESIITGFVNPEYGAMEDIINAIARQ